jgi:hypothetical protein
VAEVDLGVPFEARQETQEGSVQGFRGIRRGRGD